ncbi:hypothetical protein [Aliikangiella sp. G2MR2-5]|uniref:COG4648 family protein n=1 Tax=Aliikangiella sp. G2MR2-5 TaxID=2788943 RepID=UPI0018AAA419|nr:hypothetical protein [Aliikangiella sp. G2MR2-5]
MKLFFKIIIGGIAFAYPIIIFFGIKYFDIKYLFFVLLVVLAGRYILISGENKKFFSSQKWLIIAVLVIVLLAMSFDAATGLKLYPAAMNFSFLLLFVGSLLYPPSIIEKVARIQQPDLDEDGVAYTRKVTIVWCTFFLLNGLVALWTAFYESLEVWTFYNGFLSYILMGSLFLGELFYRKWVLRK